MGRGVGIILGFQGKAAAPSVADASLARRAVKEIAAVELQPWQVCIDSQADAALVALCIGGFVKAVLLLVVENPVVVVPGPPLQLLEIIVNALPDGSQLAKIHRGACCLVDCAVRQGLRVSLCQAVGEDLQLVPEDAAILTAVQVEIAVIGQVADGIGIGKCLIGNPQCVVLSQLVGYMHLKIAREASVPVRAEIGHKELALLLACSPQLAVKATAAAVEAVGLAWAVVGLQLIVSAIYSNPGILDAVGVASYNGTHVKGFCFVACGIVKAPHDILHLAVPVRYQEAL